MGMDINTARFIISSYKAGLRFRRILTLGKQTLFVTDEEAKVLQDELTRVVPHHTVSLVARGSAEPIFQALGAEEIVAMDKSDFEGAALLHDLNFPIPDDYKEQFDLIYDGGTLEHIFNFPIAIKNIMEMVKVGGHLINQTPANNWCGHGFYQFSPELYYRVLSEVNGFNTKRMITFEWGVNNWYEVADPAEVGSRVYIVNSCRTSLLILSNKVASVAINQQPPQQSDYVLAKWKAGVPEFAMAAATPTPPKTAQPSFSASPVLTTQQSTIVDRQVTLRQVFKASLNPTVLKFAKSLLQKTQATRNPDRRDYFLKNPAKFTPVDYRNY